MKITLLKRGTKQMKRSGFKPQKGPKVKSKKVKREKLPSVKTMRNKCDSLLTPIIKKIFPRCLLCYGETQVAHHHVHKSKSTRLRYELSNLINLCNSCHLRLHHNESYEASRIVGIRGLDWFIELDAMKNEIVKADRYYFIENYERLNKILNEKA